jgi:serine/threonine protein phosphatase PrpC
MIVRAATKIESGGRGEDRLVVERNGDQLLIVVADGAGGTGGGAAAAQAVCDAAVASWREDSSPNPWDARLKAIDAWLVGAASGGQTTMVVAEVVDGRVRGASVGDSAAWMLTRNDIRDLTADQVRKPLQGTGAAVPTAFEAPLQDRLLIGSDGLFKYVRPERIVELASHPVLDEAVAGLVDAARLKNGRLQDDVAVVLCELVSTGPSTSAKATAR